MITGVHFRNGNSATCQFGAQRTRAEVSSKTLLRCKAPIVRSVSDTVVLDFGENLKSLSSLESFTYSAAEITEIVPNFGTKAGLTKILVYGSNFSAFDSTFCRFCIQMDDFVFVVCCLLLVGRCLMCCLLFVVCCLLFVVCCLLFVVYCLLFVVCC
jgi:hypothetical protein